MPGVLPLALIALIVSVTKLQLLAESWPDQEQPEEGLVSMSIQIVVQRLEVTPLMSSLTWVVAFLPRQGNIYTSVANPAARAFCRLELALGSDDPGDLQARTIAKVFPLFLRQVKVAADIALAISTPFTALILKNRRVAIKQNKICFIRIIRQLILRFAIEYMLYN